MGMLLNSQDLSERLNKSESTIRRWKTQGIIPYIQPVEHGAVLYDYGEVVRALRKRTRQHRKKKEKPQPPQGE